jgi:hypothetical protein
MQCGILLRFTFTLHDILFYSRVLCNLTISVRPSALAGIYLFYFIFLWIAVKCERRGEERKETRGEGNEGEEVEV